MTMEEAIQTAIEYETRIRDLYRQAAEESQNPAATRFYYALADDEANHLAYLKDRLEKWRDTGHIIDKNLEKNLPSMVKINREVDKIKHQMTEADQRNEKRMLSKALKLEVDTSRYYKELVSKTDNEGKRMFGRFVKIEDEHIDMVQAELDYISGTGYWLDVKEFDMSGY